MKKFFCLILAALLLVPFSGCYGINSTTSLTLYYPRIDYGYNTQEGKFLNSIIETEQRDDVVEQDIVKLLKIYLDGPIDQTLANPFPAALSLNSAGIYDQTLYISVSDHLSELTGIDLMIACACLARTGMELTNTSCVQISCDNALLDGKKHVVLKKADILFEDVETTTID